MLNSTGAVAQIGSWGQVASGDESVSATQAPLPHHQLEAIQRSTHSAGLTDHLVGQGHLLVCRCQRQTRRCPQFSDAAVQFCLTIKNLFGLALRQTTGFVQSLLALSGLPWPVPDFSTLYRRQRNLDVQVAYRPSSAGLHLLVDSTGIKFLGEGG